MNKTIARKFCHVIIFLSIACRTKLRPRYRQNENKNKTPAAVRRISRALPHSETRRKQSGTEARQLSLYHNRDYRRSIASDGGHRPCSNFVWSCYYCLRWKRGSGRPANDYDDAVRSGFEFRRRIMLWIRAISSKK